MCCVQLSPRPPLARSQKPVALRSPFSKPSAKDDSSSGEAAQPALSPGAHASIEQKPAVMRPPPEVAALFVSADERRGVDVLAEGMTLVVIEISKL